MHENEQIQQQVFERRIPIEACIASNINTMRLQQGVAAHPLQEWLNRKHPVVLCTDNEGLLGSSLTQHYAMLTPHLSRNQIFDLAESSVEHVFEGEVVRSELRSMYKATRSKLVRNAQTVRT
jgi:adenosine deaminase